MYSWNQPCCLGCWYLHHPAQAPLYVDNLGDSTCVYCGGRAMSGIMVRISPTTAPFPVRYEDEDGDG